MLDDVVEVAQKNPTVTAPAESVEAYVQTTFVGIVAATEDAVIVAESEAAVNTDAAGAVHETKLVAAALVVVEAAPAQDKQPPAYVDPLNVYEIYTNPVKHVYPDYRLTPCPLAAPLQFKIPGVAA